MCPEATEIPPAETILDVVDDSQDVPRYGVLIAALLEEKMALHRAEFELRRATARAIACAHSLAAVYGEDIATGKEDHVVELSVRGTKMTTLRSTLRVCRESALYARFDEDKRPTMERDLDDHGRRVIDCSPAVFSKVLDVLRMRKREAWGNDDEGQRGRGGTLIAVRGADRAAFEEFVNMHFPGCESFLLDNVDFFNESKEATRESTGTDGEGKGRGGTWR